MSRLKINKLKLFGFIIGVFSFFSLSMFSNCAFRVEARHVSSGKVSSYEEYKKQKIIVTLGMNNSGGVVANGATVEVAKRIICASFFKLIKEGTGIDLNKYLVRGDIPSYRTNNLDRKFALRFAFPEGYDAKIIEMSADILKYISDKLLKKDGSASEILQKEIKNVFSLIYNDNKNEEIFKKNVENVVKVYKSKGIKNPKVQKKWVISVIKAILKNGIDTVNKEK